MLVIRPSQQARTGKRDAESASYQSCPGDPQWIEFQLVDMNNEPVPSEPYRIRMPDQSLSTGKLDN